MLLWLQPSLHIDPVIVGAIPVYRHAPGHLPGRWTSTWTAGGACDTAMRSRGSRHRRRRLQCDARWTFIPWAIGPTMRGSSSCSRSPRARTIPWSDWPRGPDRATAPPDSVPIANAVIRLRNSRILVSLSAERRVPDGNGLCGSNSFDPDRGFQVSRPRKVEGELHPEPRFGS